MSFSVVRSGTYFVTFGALAALDPFVSPNPSPFTQAIPAGRYPVSVAIACFGEGRDERMAFARLSETEDAD